MCYKLSLFQSLYVNSLNLLGDPKKIDKLNLKSEKFHFLKISTCSNKFMNPDPVKFGVQHSCNPGFVHWPQNSM